MPISYLSAIGLNAFKTHVKPRYKKMLVLLAISAVFIVAIVGYGIYRFWVEQPTNLGYDTDLSQADLPKEMAAPDEKPIARDVSGSTSAEKLKSNGTKRASSEPDQSVRAQRSDQNARSVKNSIKELFSLRDPDKTTASNSEQPSAPTAFNLEPSAEATTLELMQDLQNVTRQMSHVIEQIGYLESYVSSLSEKVNTLKGSVGPLDSRLSELTNTTTDLAMNVVSLRADVAHFNKILRIDGVQRDLAQDSASDQKRVSNTGEKIMIERLSEYRVYAIIPGRAWLKSVEGKIKTVSEGDPIENYGTILAIDHENGTVVTSSSVVFR